MQSIVPLIFLLFLIPGIVYGIVAGTVKTHRDVVAGHEQVDEHDGLLPRDGVLRGAVHRRVRRSRTSARWWRCKGAAFLQALALPGQVTIVGIILLTALVNLLIGSASAKWALLAPIFVPMLMQVGPRRRS